MSSNKGCRQHELELTFSSQRIEDSATNTPGSEDAIVISRRGFVIKITTPKIDDARESSSWMLLLLVSMRTSLKMCTIVDTTAEISMQC
jgi:hypothetical protein